MLESGGMTIIQQRSVIAVMIPRENIMINFFWMLPKRSFGIVNRRRHNGAYINLPRVTARQRKSNNNECQALKRKSFLLVAYKIYVMRAIEQEIIKPSADNVAIPCITIGKKAKTNTTLFKNGIYLIQKYRIITHVIIWKSLAA